MICPVCSSDAIIGDQLESSNKKINWSWLECCQCGWKSDPLESNSETTDVWLRLERQLSSGFSV